jgi:hypothetical protein
MMCTLYKCMNYDVHKRSACALFTNVKRCMKRDKELSRIKTVCSSKGRTPVFEAGNNSSSLLQTR